MKIKFHLKDNIEWHCMKLELNLNIIEIPLNLIQSS